MYNILRCQFSYFITSNYSNTTVRYIRNPSKRAGVLKTIKEFKVKHLNEEDEYDTRLEMEEMSQRIKENDLDIEEAFEKGSDFGTIVAESGKLYEKQISEEKSQRSFIKKKLIGRKYFKSGKETNLLTYAAKEQIRYLHKSNPLDWTPETLSKSFPISVEGVKKLLKSYFTLKDPERIKIHDEDVRKKWESLISGKPSDEIYFHTQCLWNEGKLLKENYNGNPNLPHVPDSTTQNITKIEKKKPTGEFSAIIKNYVEYKNQTQLIGKNNSELIVSTKSELNKKGPSEEAENKLKASHFIKKSKFFKEDGDIVIKKRNSVDDEAELPFSEFKENMKHEFKSKKSNTSRQYHQWIEKDTKEKDFKNSSSAFNTKEFVSKISKYNKESIEMKRDKNRELYLYNDETGYQFPVGQTVKGRISVPSSMKKKKSLYKVKQCVYDDDGELLYKLPG